MSETACARLQYDSVEEGMAAVVDLYLQQILDLISRQHFEIFVHPVPPVLNETRHIVRLFMRLLKKKVQVGGLGFCL